ncbi:hypothetical protein MANES_14G153850v8 [Manihot esculenta]|uniref:Uncharacterized protein n=1 Tax=Manihot esculenta TaxID=3983 RepID=A0ACB7GH20_MANES|nr:hypothetical protein MANES_14G153850v8 [Manihot esculenta]
MKQYADRRSEREFTVGDMVYLKLQPCRQASWALRKNFKLTARFYGTYQVIAKVGPVACKLQLTSDLIVHPVFHVSLLKMKVGDQTIIIQDLPSFSEDYVTIMPEAVLKTRSILRNGKRFQQGLIKWCNLPLEEATWEDQHFIFKQFPEFRSSWGQEESSGEGIVTSS